MVIRLRLRFSSFLCIFLYVLYLFWRIVHDQTSLLVLKFRLTFFTIHHRNSIKTGDRSVVDFVVLLWSTQTWNYVTFRFSETFLHAWRLHNFCKWILLSHCRTQHKLICMPKNIHTSLIKIHLSKFWSHHVVKVFWKTKSELHVRWLQLDDAINNQSMTYFIDFIWCILRNRERNFKTRSDLFSKWVRHSAWDFWGSIGGSEKGVQRSRARVHRSKLQNMPLWLQKKLSVLHLVYFIFLSAFPLFDHEHFEFC